MGVSGRESMRLILSAPGKIMAFFEMQIKRVKLPSVF